MSGHEKHAIIIPEGAKRIVILSNCKGKLPKGAVREGDLCVHLNRAAFKDEAMAVPGTWHELIVRHGRDSNNNVIWFTPDKGVSGFSCVHFTPTINGWSGSMWWRLYRDKTGGKSPTTGFLAYRAASLVNSKGLPVILVGFNPSVDMGTYRSPKHGWDYEAATYAREKANIINLITDTSE